MSVAEPPAAAAAAAAAHLVCTGPRKTCPGCEVEIEVGAAVYPVQLVCVVVFLLCCVVRFAGRARQTAR
jgi:hypothetical protein